MRDLDLCSVNSEYSHINTSGDDHVGRDGEQQQQQGGQLANNRHNWQNILDYASSATSSLTEPTTVFTTHEQLQACICRVERLESEKRELVTKLALKNVALAADANLNKMGQKIYEKIDKMNDVVFAMKDGMFTIRENVSAMEQRKLANIATTSNNNQCNKAHLDCAEVERLIQLSVDQKIAPMEQGMRLLREENVKLRNELQECRTEFNDKLNDGISTLVGKSVIALKKELASVAADIKCNKAHLDQAELGLIVQQTVREHCIPLEAKIGEFCAENNKQRKALIKLMETFEEFTKSNNELVAKAKCEQHRAQLDMLLEKNVQNGETTTQITTGTTTTKGKYKSPLEQRQTTTPSGH